MPPFDETARVGPSAGQVRRPPAARAANGGGAAGPRRPAAPSRSRATASRSGEARPPAARSGGGGGRPPVKPPTGGRRPGGSGSGAGRPPGGAGKKRTGKQRRRRFLKFVAGAFLGMLVLLGVFVGVVYASTEVPSPDSITNKQTTVLYYADGVTEMARLSDGENRTSVPLAQISEPARNAVLAAENRGFYSDPGISFTGIARAAWNNVTGGSTQGGSTITQQYVKNAILNSDQTFSRKFKELFLAVKLDNEYSKDEILENYLNTIYFGRGAYGIETAANTYFGVPASQLTAEQGAVLAVLIRNPSANDPETNPEGAQKRWGLVLDAMVEAGWVDPAARTPMAYPPVQPRTGANLGIPSGPEGLIVEQVLDELTGPGMGFENVEGAGLRVTTTIDKGHQDAAVAAVNDVMDGEDPGLRQALVAVDPRTGGVVAYYGNKQHGSDDPTVDTTDYAQAYKQPGSSFKPYTVATALQNGFSVDTRRDGTSPQEFPDREREVVNSGNAQCAACTIKEAVTRSLNTTFYGLAYDLGPAKVAEQARAAMGIGETWPDDGSVPETLRGKTSLASPENGQTGGAIGIGEYEVRPIDQAVGFATLAAGGMYHERHFVAQVADTTGAVLRTVTGAENARPVIPAEVASDTTFAMEDVAKSSKRALEGNRPVASKTGTQGLGAENSDAWMVGFTPSISTAVWMGTQGIAPIRDAQGKIIYGSGLPGQIWQQFMDAALAGTPEEPLPAKAVIKADPQVDDVAEATTEAPASTSQAPVTQEQQQATQAPAPSTAAQSTGAAESRARERARAEAERARQAAASNSSAAAARSTASTSSVPEPTATPEPQPAQPSAPVQPIPTPSTN
ncbi:transglycosylase domain-containing protein [Modestobacter sp. SSW1-42]|uniref:transglycosylase domain-containing protein n=1 Tax=Modestobacter sp. SSW1-42 TaxID=596372 RepID=UPI0039863FAB